MIHELKILPAYFAAIEGGIKRFEIRKADRPYSGGDILILREWDGLEERYTGNELLVRVTYLIDDGFDGVESGYCVMSIHVIEEKNGDSNNEGREEAERKLKDALEHFLLMCERYSDQHGDAQ